MTEKLLTVRNRAGIHARPAALIAQTANKFACEVLLEKARDTKAQSTLRGREARRKNAAGAYRAVRPEAIRGKRILLVDDIVTTGETLMECARVLKAAGAKSVTAVTVARKRE